MAEETLSPTRRPAIPAGSPLAAPALQIIERQEGWACIHWSEIWRYRELLFFLTLRDVTIRYKQTVLGAAWAVLQPLVNMVIFSLFFGRLAGLSAHTQGIPYPIYVYAGLLPWTFFANSITSSGNSLVASSNLITKVYFPRLIIPLAAVGAGLVDLAISFLVLLGMMLYYRTGLSWFVLLVPLLFLGTVVAAAGVGTLLAALTVTYRDFRYIVPFMVQTWMFLTPVIYPSAIVATRWRWLFYLNPMAGLVDGCRSALLGRPMDWPQVGLSLAITSVGFHLGSVYFRRTERRFADVI